MMDHLKLLGTTAVMSLLIWVTADSLVSETLTLNVAVQLEPTDPSGSMLVELPDAERVVEIQVAGPRRTIDSLVTEGPLAARLAVPDLPTGSAELPLDEETLQEALSAEYPNFRKLRVVAVTPRALAITVDHLIGVEFAITTRRLTLAYEVEPQLRRTTAIVRMRESRYQQRQTAGLPNEIDIAAELERLLRDRPAGQPVRLDVSLDVEPFGPNATLAPEAVRVTATLASQRVSEVIPTVPILLAVSFSNLDKPYRAVTLDGSTLVTRPIRVTGSPEAVARLRRGETRAYGIIQLKQADFDDPDRPKLAVPEILLPAGVQLAEEPAQVDFRLVPPPATDP